MLGAGVCGGAKRATSVLTCRLSALCEKARRFQARRRAEVAAAHMVKTADTPCFATCEIRAVLTDIYDDTITFYSSILLASFFM